MMFDKLEQAIEDLDFKRNQLLKLRSLINGESQVFICNDKNYGVYRSDKDPIYGNHEGNKFTLNVVNFKKSYETCMENWFVPTVEGYLVDINLIGKIDFYITTTNKVVEHHMKGKTRVEIMDTLIETSKTEGGKTQYSILKDIVQSNAKTFICREKPLDSFIFLKYEPTGHEGKEFTLDEDTFFENIDHFLENWCVPTTSLESVDIRLLGTVPGKLYTNTEEGKVVLEELSHITTTDGLEVYKCVTCDNLFGGRPSIVDETKPTCGFCDVGLGKQYKDSHGLEKVDEE